MQQQSQHVYIPNGLGYGNGLGGLGNGLGGVGGGLGGLGNGLGSGNGGLGGLGGGLGTGAGNNGLGTGGTNGAGTGTGGGTGGGTSGGIGGGTGGGGTGGGGGTNLTCPSPVNCDSPIRCVCPNIANNTGVGSQTVNNLCFNTAFRQTLGTGCNTLQSQNIQCNPANLVNAVVTLPLIGTIDLCTAIEIVASSLGLG